MPPVRRAPFSVVFCYAMIRIASQLVPATQRQDWKREWFAEVWHRWQFLLHAGEWNRHESWRLIRNCLGVFADAGWHFASQEAVQSRFREWSRSPWLCLGTLSALLSLVGLSSGGFAASRQVFFAAHGDRTRVLFMWLHPIAGGDDKGIPSDVVPAWAKHSALVEAVAGFNVSHVRVSIADDAGRMPLVVRTDPSLFTVFGVRPEFGIIPGTSGVLLDHRTWVVMFHADPKVIGSTITVSGEAYQIAAVLPANFRLVSRQPSVYVVQHELTDAPVMVVARIRQRVSEAQLHRELTKIAENSCYYFFGSGLRLRSLESAVITPLRFFGIAVLIAISMTVAVSRVRIRRLRMAWAARFRAATLRRYVFFAAKLGLAQAFVFSAGLESSRSNSSILFASKDPANGPFLVWLYILGAMGVLFWSLADQRARCRVCLRLLCFPVRIGCPGCLLLDWSGTESVCAEGHGVLHVPHMAPSWDEEAEHWITLDDSWRGLFAQTK